MGYAAVRTGISEEEYLAFERDSPEKHAYADGEIFAMSGETGDHCAVAANILGELGNALFGGKGRVYPSNLRIRIHAIGRYVYPDASVVCARPEYTDEERDTLVNPQVIIEVLSESSEAHDRGDKLAQYQTIPSLTQYVIASQSKPRIEVFTRQEDDGGWLLRTYGPGEHAILSSVGCAIDVDLGYTDVLEGEPAQRVVQARVRACLTPLFRSISATMP